mgnify:CR=1 FL=1
MTDENGLVYLRARYYLPGSGRFITKDTWEGDYFISLSLNKWLYTENNPIDKIDSSGLKSTDGPPCSLAYRYCQLTYFGNAIIDTDHFESSKEIAANILSLMADRIGDRGSFPQSKPFDVPGLGTLTYRATYTVNLPAGMDPNGGTFERIGLVALFDKFVPHLRDYPFFSRKFGAGLLVTFHV